MAIPEGKEASLSSWVWTLLWIGAASFGTIKTDTGMWHLFRVWIDVDATTSLLEAEICLPKDETEICSWLIGLSCNWLASSWVMKEHWAPSSKRICPSTVVYPPEILAMAVFNKHTLVEIAESDVVDAAVDVSSLWVVVLTIWAVVVTVGGVTWLVLVVTAGVGCDLWAGSVVLVKVWQRLVWCFLWYSLHVKFEGIETPCGVPSNWNMSLHS